MDSQAFYKNNEPVDLKTSIFSNHKSTVLSANYLNAKNENFQERRKTSQKSGFLNIELKLGM